MAGVNELIEKKFQTGVFDVKQTLIAVNESVEKRLLEQRTENALKFTALATNQQMPEERISAAEKKIEQFGNTVISTREVQSTPAAPTVAPLLNTQCIVLYR
jgi:hypothetical protein